MAQTGHWFPALRPEVLDQGFYDDVTNNLAEDRGRDLPILPNNQPNFHSSDFSSDSDPHSSLYNTRSVEELKSQYHPVTTPLEETDEPPLLSSSQPAQTSTADEASSDDENKPLDPAWGIKRVDTTKILQNVHRSSSFPAFADPSMNETLHKSLPQQGYGLEANEVLPDSSPYAEEDVDLDEHRQVAWHEDEVEAPLEEYPWSAASEPVQVDDATQRFEEGIPLMQHAEELNPSTPKNDEQGFPDASPPSKAAEDPQSEPSLDNTDEAVSVVPHPLDRKSTHQIMDSLNISPEHRSDSPDIANHEESSFFDNLTNVVEENKVAEADPSSAGVDSLWAAALDDDEEFLVEDADDLLPDSEPASPSLPVSSLDSSAAPASESFSNARTAELPSSPRWQNSVNAYAPHQPSVANMLQLSPPSNTTHNNLGLSRPGLGQNNSFQSHLQSQRPPAPQTTKSFVDQAKDGYKSPYDLPLELSKSRRRAPAPQPVQTSKTLAPPPRSSSLSEKPVSSPFTPAAQSTPTSDHHSPGINATSVATRSASAFLPTAKSVEHKKSSSSSFFEELPVVSKQRPASNTGRYTPQQHPQAIPQLPPQSPTQVGPQIPLSPPRAPDPYAQFQLRAPERLDPYANHPSQPPASIPSVPNSRYSPAPPVVANASQRASVGPRYSPAPPSQTSAPQVNRYASQPTAPSAPPPLNRAVSHGPMASAPPANVLPFQPRTSSPLAYHKSSAGEGSYAAVSAPLVPKPGPLGIKASHATNYMPQPGSTAGTLPASNNLTSPPRTTSQENLPPPRRSQTQSPSKQRPQPAYHSLTRNEVPNRPASAYGQSSSIGNFTQPDPYLAARSQLRTKTLPQDMDFVRPSDESQFDPLERWKGAPLFTFGFGGAVAATFPKHVPRYTTGVARPQIKSSPGEISVRNIKDILPQNEVTNSFPGPLRSKAKKKDVLSWMSTYITALESAPTRLDAIDPSFDTYKLQHEKLLLWQIVRTLVEHDGVLDGAALGMVNRILSPEIHAVDQATASQYRGDHHLTGIYRPSGASVRTDSTDTMAVETLRKRLLSGDRQSAVIHAMDSRLWSHALVISSTMERSMWSQVVREFVRQEVRTVGDNAEALSALYEIFGGNLEESIDELVPPSARAGLQMMSKVDNLGPTKNALDGLDRWKESLSLILNNRSPGDHQALAVLGKLLEDYHRIDAAHICYLFSRNSSKGNIFGGIDDEQTPIVLLGADHKARPFDFARDHDAILLTEIYEFATNILSPGSPSTSTPHLAVYKLHRATLLAENGLRSEAQSYCDTISATYKSSTKLSPYYHPLFTAELEDLSARLKQTPMQGSSSWIGKPSLEKVSGSVWNKFTTFVAGDDSDAESKGSGKDVGEAGPFANVSGTPSVSRSASQSDLYGSVYPLASPPIVSNTIAASRYAPNGLQSTRSSSELTRGRVSLDAQRSPPATSQTNRQFEPLDMLQETYSIQPTNPYQPVGTASPNATFTQSPPRPSYIPNGLPPTISNLGQPVQQDPYIMNPPADSGLSQPYGYHSDSYANVDAPFGLPEGTSTFGAYRPSPEAGGTITPPQESSTYGYGDSTASYGYDAPIPNGYVPYVPEPDSPEEVEKPKKKTFMNNDDDDDNFPRNSAPASPSMPHAPQDTDAMTRKQQNDAAADAAFRAAAEADAAREKEKNQSKRSSSWFGGWLGGKKPADGLDSGASKGAEPKVYKAKLGESKMKLYYDKELGKWVNPDNPDAAQKSATPPPPRMGGTPAPPTGPPRAPVVSHGSNSQLPNASVGSRSATPAGPPIAMLNPHTTVPSVASAPGSAASTPPPGNAPTSHPGLGPPPLGGSRPGTAVSNSSSIDDLIGPATGRKSTGKGTKKAKGRYVDVMAK